MITWETYRKIRQYKNQGGSKAACAEELNLSWPTVHKYWDGDVTPDDRKLREVPASEREIFVKNYIIEYLEKWKECYTGKHVLAITEIGKELLDKKIIIPYTTLNRYYNEVVKETYEAFIPLTFEPGEVMQIDWFKARIKYRNKYENMPVFLLILPYSGAFFSMLMPDMKKETFAYGHVEAFRFFGGVADKCWYDNLKTAVASGVSKNAIKTELLIKLEAHYGYNGVFMNPRQGHEKGSVERCVRTCRRLLYTKVNIIDSIEEFNQKNLAKLLIYFKNHKVGSSQLTIDEKLNIERNKLNPLPIKEFDIGMSKECKINRYSQVHFETCTYSVPTEYNGQKATIIWHPFKIDIWCDGKCIATHTRSIIKNSEISDPKHYYKILLGKPRAIQNASPLKNAKLTKEREEFVSSYDIKEKGEIVFKLLQLDEKFGENIVNNEIIKCNLVKDHSLNNLIKNLSKKYKPINNIKIDNIIDNYDDLINIPVILDSLSDYDSLIVNNSDDSRAINSNNCHENGNNEEVEDE